MEVSLNVKSFLAVYTWAAIKNVSLNRVPKLFRRRAELFALRASFTPTLGDGTGGVDERRQL